MICPSCGTINKDSAKMCRECRLHLAGRGSRPEDKKKERKFVIVGAITLAVIATMLIMFFSLLCDTCGIGCGGREDAINEQVEGDWDAVGEVSVSDVSASDNSDFLDDPGSLSD